MIGNKEQIANTQKDEYRNQREIHLNSYYTINDYSYPINNKRYKSIGKKYSCIAELLLILFMLRF